MSCWIEAEFAAVDLGDKRLNRRLWRVVKKMWQSPQGSTATACGSWKETMGAYRLFDNEAVTAEQILAPHREQVAARCRLAKVVLHIQDTSELDYSKKKSLEGTGPLSEENRQGFFAHNEYVVQEEGGLPLGLWHTDIHARDPEEHGESQRRKQLPIQEKESFRWLEGYRRACALQEQCPEVQVISTSDRESDIYEIFAEYQQRRERNQVAADWIIRSNQDRALLPSGNTQAPDPQRLKLHACIEQAPVLGTTTLKIRAKKQLKKKKGSRQLTDRKARKAVLEVRACEVQLKPPFRKGTKLAPITLRVVMAKEINPPAGEDPIEWILLTNLAVQNLDDALHLIALYCLRWQIEVFHKILKSGCRVEQAQFKTAERLRPWIALQMVLAWRIHHVTLAGRACPDLPCGILFDPCEWKSVVLVVRGEGAETTEPTLAEMINYVAQLGGYLNRKCDGPPGPQTIWRGMQRMRDFAILWQACGKGP
jgi:hypothetical protein